MKNCSKKKFKKIVAMSLILVMCLVCFTGCGSKETYLDIYKSMTDAETGTWSGSWTWYDGESYTSFNYVRKVNETGGELFNLTVSFDEENSVVINTIVQDGVRYLDLGEMRDSLLACKDADLKSLADSLPNNIAFLKESDSNWVLGRFYAEEDEIEAGVYGIPNMLDRLDLMMNMFLGALNQKGAFEMSSEDNIYTLTSNDNLNSILVQMLREMDIYYDKYGSNIQSLGLASEYEISQGIANQKDNFLTRLGGYSLKYSLYDSETINAKISGSMNLFESDATGREIDGNLSISWVDPATTLTKSIVGSFSYIPSVGQWDSVSSTTISLSEFTSTYTDFNSILEDILIYGNVLECTYIDNEINLTDEVALRELEEFSREYLGIDSSVADYVMTNPTSADVISMLNIYDEVVGGFVVEVEKEQEVVDVSRFNKIEGTLDNGVEYILTVNEEESDSSIMVVDCRLLNTSELIQTIRTKDFKIKNLGTDIISANIKSQLLEVNPEFDTTLYLDRVELSSNSFIDIKLYFVLPEESGYFDVYLSDNCLGNLVSY